MGTRGFIGFVDNQIERITYNHFDSYPSGLGVDVLAWARQADFGKVREQVRNLLLVDESSKPTPEEWERFAHLADTRVSSGDDWYALLRNTQGSPQAILDAGAMIDSHGFPLDSLFCEYGYLVNLDDGTFEVYEGLNKTLPTAGRWAGRPTPEEDLDQYAKHVEWCQENGRDPWLPQTPDYKAVRLWEVWPLHDLPTEKEFLDRLEGEVEG